MNSISFCITAYDQDYHLIDPLLDRLKLQTEAPDEIFVFCSGVSELNIQKSITINGVEVKVRKALSNTRVMQSVARNMCARYATGKYCMFFDVDDIPHNQKFELTKKLLNDYNPDFFLHTYEMGDIQLTEIKRITKANLFSDFRPVDRCTNIIVWNTEEDKAYEDKPIHHAHITVLRSILNSLKYNIAPEYYRREDGKFCQDLLENGYKGLYLDKKLINYT